MAHHPGGRHNQPTIPATKTGKRGVQVFCFRPSWVSSMLASVDPTSFTAAITHRSSFLNTLIHFSHIIKVRLNATYCKGGQLYGYEKNAQARDLDDFEVQPTWMRTIKL